MQLLSRAVGLEQSQLRCREKGAKVKLNAKLFINPDLRYKAAPAD
jgi:hypothetical protein